MIIPVIGQQELTMDQVMSSEELKSTGVVTLSPTQRKALDRWLMSYTFMLLAEKKRTQGCDPAIEARIDGDFNGWTGDTVYKLQNGQIWQQASYHYHYHYAYSPEVTIFSGNVGCVMRVSDDDDGNIPVRRLK